MQSLHTPSDLSVMFDDDHAVANAGLALTGLLSEKLGLEELCDETISIVPFPGRRSATLVHAMIVGASCIDDADVLRAGSTASVLSHRVMAPSTLGTFLRGFTFGHVRQLDRVSETLMTRAWALGADPGEEPMTIDMDSTVCEVHGKQKGGASYGYTKVLGYHPVLATRAETGEVLHLRFRKGSANTQRGAQRFVRETVGRVRRAGASGELTLRADSGFFSKYVVQACRDHQVRYSITVAVPSNPKGHRTGRRGRLVTHRLHRERRGLGRRHSLPGTPSRRASHQVARPATDALSRLPLPRLHHRPRGRRHLPRRRSPSSRRRRTRHP